VGGCAGHAGCSKQSQHHKTRGRCVRQAADMVEGLTKSIDAYMGDVGVTRDLAHRWELVTVCFDMASLCTGEPSDSAIAAFSELWAISQPELLVSSRSEQVTAS
jgi:hypothetical protein